MVQSIPNFVLFDKKMVNNFGQSVDASLEDVSVTKIQISNMPITLLLAKYATSRTEKSHEC